MALKDGIRARLLQGSRAGAGDWLSGEDLSREFGVSRTAVWKAVEGIRSEGFAVESSRNRGYRLAADQDALTEEGILGNLLEYSTDVHLSVEKRTGSTNADAKMLAEAGAPELTCLVAGEQTAGRGRRGRPFFSLGDTGVYLSIVLRPHWSLDRAALITGAAAVAVCRALDPMASGEPRIKWVNDIYIAGRKVCGILTEGSADLETGGLAYAVVGIGVNVYEPDGGFPEEISRRAGAVLTRKRQGMRDAIAARIIREFIGIYRDAAWPGFIGEYRSRSFLLGGISRGGRRFA